jgi:hypothetical protein
VNKIVLTHEEDPRVLYVIEEFFDEEDIPNENLESEGYWAPCVDGSVEDETIFEAEAVFLSRESAQQTLDMYRENDPEILVRIVEYVPRYTLAEDK